MGREPTRVGATVRAIIQECQTEDARQHFRYSEPEARLLIKMLSIPITRSIHNT